MPLLLVATLAALTTLGGCLGLRADGTVRTGLPIDAAQANQAVYLPPGPQAGASPEEIIRGFLRAGAVTGDAITVAQSFLTRRLVPRWDPDHETVVISADAAVTVTARGGGTYAVSAPVQGRIDSTGRYARASLGERVAMTLTVADVGGQSRITRLPADLGRWMSPAAVRQQLRAVDVHYVASASDALVPDVRWLPNDRMATRLVRAQFGPVPTYLGAAARTDLGGGVHLTVDAVPVVDGVATVDLAAAGLPTDETSRRNIWAQLVATLTQAPNVYAVDVTVEGAAFDLPAVPGPIGSVEQLGVREAVGPSGVAPLLRIGEGVYRVDPARVLDPGLDAITEEGTPFPVIPEVWTDLALSFAGTEVAGVGTDRAALARWRADRTIEVPFFADRLTRPAYDRANVLWIGGRGTGTNADSRLWAINTAVDATNLLASAPYPVRAPWLDGRLVRSVDVSVDGIRIAIVSTDAKGRDPQLAVAGIARRPNGLPVALGAQPLRLGADIAELSDAVWTSPTELAVLGRSPEETEPQPFLVTLGDDARALPGLDGARAITTVGGERGLALITGDAVALRAGTRWITIPAGTDLAVPAR